MCEGSVFCNPLEDGGFKLLFCEKVGKNNMLNFLRALLPELDIHDIVYLNSGQLEYSSWEEGKAIFDLCDCAFWAGMNAGQRHEIELHKNMTTRNDILVAIAEAEEYAIIRGTKNGL